MLSTTTLRSPLDIFFTHNWISNTRPNYCHLCSVCSSHVLSLPPGSLPGNSVPPCGLLLAQVSHPSPSRKDLQLR
jgi:hypothetical protein